MFRRQAPQEILGTNIDEEDVGEDDLQDDPPKKSHMSLHFSLSRRPPRSWDWVFPMALPPFYVAYLFSPCFGLSSCVFP